MLARVFSLADLPTTRQRVAIAIGTFDGVHRGHGFIIGALRELAKGASAAPMVVMFDYPPALHFNPELPCELITLPDERLRLLGEQGIEVILYLAFDKRIASIMAREFLDSVNTSFDVQGLLVGYDHRIGSDMLTRDEDFLRITGQVGIGFKRVGRKKYGRWTVASSLVRRMIREARLRAASALLGRHHFVSGVVIEGEHVGGKSLACPTANILVPQHKLAPPPGVYAAVAYIAGARGAESGRARAYNAAVNIMPARCKAVYASEAPDRMLVESHFLDFAGDLYGETVRVEFVRRVRPERSFRSVDALKAQIELDIEGIRKLDARNVPIPADEEVRGVLDAEAGE